MLLNDPDEQTHTIVKFGSSTLMKFLRLFSFNFSFCLENFFYDFLCLIFFLLLRFKIKTTVDLVMVGDGGGGYGCSICINLVVIPY